MKGPLAPGKVGKVRLSVSDFATPLSGSFSIHLPDIPWDQDRLIDSFVAELFGRTGQFQGDGRKKVVGHAKFSEIYCIDNSPVVPNPESSVAKEKKARAEDISMTPRRDMVGHSCRRSIKDHSAFSYSHRASDGKVEYGA